MIKKHSLISWLIGLFVCVSVLLVLPLNAIAASSGNCGKNGNNLTYTLTDDGILTISGSGEMADIADSELDTYEFTENEAIKELVIQEGVTSIGNYAFSGCSNLEKVTLPNSLKTIGTRSFYETGIKTITLPSGLTTIGYYAFLRCESLSNISIPDTVTMIAGGAFEQCSSLTSVKIPKGITKIDTLVFAESGLTSISIPGNAVIIGGSAFQSCKNLTTVILEHGVESLSSSAFAECTALKRIDLPTSLRFISAQCFNQDTSLKDIYFAGTKSEWKIEDYSGFDYSQATIHYKSEESEKTETEKSNQPANDTTATTYTVGTCSYTVDNGNATLTSSRSKTLSKVTIPATVKINGNSVPVTAIAPNAFKGMKKLTTVAIGKNIKTIGKNAFNGCKKLKKITIKTTKLTKKTVGANAFKGIYKKAVIKCPKSKKAAYKKFLLKKGMKKTMTFK